MSMTEKMKISRDKEQLTASFLTDRSKQFDCIFCKLLIAQWPAYCFDRNALKLIYSNFCDRLQKVKEGSLSSKLHISCGATQRLIIGPLVFNTDIYDLLFTDTSSDIANYEHHSTPYQRGH